MRSRTELFLKASAPAALVAFALASASGCGDGGDSSGSTCAEAPGVICTWAGTGDLGFNGDGQPLTESWLYWPVDLTFDPDGHTYMLDWNNHRVREVTEDGTFETVIGTDFIGDGPDDMSDLMEPGAPGTDVNLNHPTQIVPVPGGNPVLVAWHNHKLREYDPETGLVTVICGGPAGFGGDGGPMRAAKLNQPNQLVVGDDGSWYILDQRNQVIRHVDPDGIIHTVAGTPGEAGFADGPANEAKFEFPAGSNPPSAGGLAIDGDKLYVSDTLNHRIRLVDLSEGTVTTIAGTGDADFGGDEGPAVDAELNNPRKLALGPDGRLYVGDEYNHRIRAIDLDEGTITTVAGNGEADFGGDGGPPLEASLNRPVGVAFGPDDSMYILDTFNSRIRRVPAE